MNNKKDTEWHDTHDEQGNKITDLRDMVIGKTYDKYDELAECCEKLGISYDPEFHRNFDDYIETYKNCSKCEPIIIMPKDQLRLLMSIDLLIANIPINEVKLRYEAIYNLEMQLSKIRQNHQLNNHPKLPGE